MTFTNVYNNVYSDMYIEGTMIMRDEANSLYIPSFINL